MRRTTTLLSMALALGGCNCESSSVGQLRSIIEVDPGEVDLGEVPVGVHAQATITVRSLGDAMLTIEEMRLAGSPIFGLTGSVDRLPPSASAEVTIAATPAEVGEATAELVIRSDDDTREELRIPIRLVGVPPPPCDDGNPCTTDTFDPLENDCDHTFADGIPCAPADRCVVEATCSQGVCLGHPKVCDDQSTCTRDYCRQATGECVFLEAEQPCDDDNPCTADACVGNGCVNEVLPSGAPCDDGDLCTVGDSCFAGECRGTGVADGNPCDDDDSCTVEDTCLQGVCTGRSIVAEASEGEIVFDYPLISWPEAFLHRREVSLSDEGVFHGLDHLPLADGGGLTHVIFAMKHCGSEAYQFAYRPPDTHVLVRFVRREMQLSPDGSIRIVVGVRQLPEDGYVPQTTTYLLDPKGTVVRSAIQVVGGETGRALLPDGSHIFGVISPLNQGTPLTDPPNLQNLVIVREDLFGNVLWRRERESTDWSEFLGVAGPRVLFWANGFFGALDFNTGDPVWTAQTQHITKEMALSTQLNLGVARASTQLLAVDILHGNQVFMFPPVEDLTYVPRTDPVISADGRVLVLMQRNNPELTLALGLDWVELAPDGSVLSETPLPYVFPEDFGLTRHEDDPYPTVADDGVAYVGYGSAFYAINPGGQIRWTLTSSVPNAYTGSVPLLRDDGILLINEDHRVVRGVRTNGGRMSPSGWASFRHDRRRTNFTP